MSEEIKLQDDGQLQIHSKNIDLEELQKVLHEMISNQKNLQKGYKILEYYIIQRNFHVGILKIIFSNMDNRNLVRFSCSILNIYIKKNWSFNALISNEEKLVKFFLWEFFIGNLLHLFFNVFLMFIYCLFIVYYIFIYFLSFKFFFRKL